MEALIIVDMQNDFLPGGSLAVPEGDQVIPVINELAEYFDLLIATQDWHPRDHKSFAEQHEGKKPGDVIELEGLEQVLWPVHCVQETKGAEFASGLNMDEIARVFKKGVDTKIDSYSGFYDNGHKRATGLHDFLKEKGVDTVAIVGLAADYCVKYTALDAVKLGYKTIVISDGARAVGGAEAFEQTMNELSEKGAIVVPGTELTAS